MYVSRTVGKLLTASAPRLVMSTCMPSANVGCRTASRSVSVM